MTYKKSIVAAMALMAAIFAYGEEEDDCFELDRWTVGAGGAMCLGEGSGGYVRGGYYLNEFWAVEATAARLEDESYFQGDILWHWWGYERLDPFFTFGGAALVHVQSGPCGGVGTFWHLDDHWSLRFDVTLLLGLEDGIETDWTLCAGIQRSF